MQLEPSWYGFCVNMVTVFKELIRLVHEELKKYSDLEVLPADKWVLLNG